MDTMHIFDTQATEEKALCGADVPAADLMGVSEYLERREDELPVGNICEPCKVPAVRWAERRVRKLEADAGEIRDRADELERMAAGCQAEGRWSEADGLEDETRELRRLVGRLKRETGLDDPGH